MASSICPHVTSLHWTLLYTTLHQIRIRGFKWCCLTEISIWCKAQPWPALLALGTQFWATVGGRMQVQVFLSLYLIKPLDDISLLKQRQFLIPDASICIQRWFSSLNPSSKASHRIQWSRVCPFYWLIVLALKMSSLKFKWVSQNKSFPAASSTNFLAIKLRPNL